MTKEELIEKTDKAIGELVYEKKDLLKAYNYYNGIRDAEQFRYLEEVYGANTPTSLHFTPLIKKHVDALIGEYLGTPIVPKVFCKDSNTITNINREKQLKLAQGLHNELKKHLQNSILNFVDGKNINDGLILQQLKSLVEDLDNTFISEYEIAALNVIEYIMLSRDTDIITKLRDILLDLLITGYTYYKVEPSIENNNIKIRSLSPLNTFVDENFESPYIKNSYRVVVRNWMSKSEILNKYGREMTKEERDNLETKWGSIYDDSVRYVLIKNSLMINGLLSDVGVTPNNFDYKYHKELIPVYEVEWIETDKDFVMLRYETVRIGEEIYILRGKNDNIIRSQSNPSVCTLSVNGVLFLNRDLKPWSLVLHCAHLQDLYDLLNFYRDNLIANSGSVGDWIDLTLIPAELGANLPERIIKWQSYKKQGIGILDSSQEGRLASGQAPLNTIFNGFDNTVKAQAILAIQLAIESIEKTTSDITGVFRERLNGIEAHDAVTNIKIGLNNSYIITKLYYHLMDLVVNELLLDCLNLAKIVFKNGLIGTFVLGDKQLKTFEALPEYFTLTDYDIRITTSSDIVKDLEQVKLIIPEFVKSGGLPPDIILEAITSKSIPDLKYKIHKALKTAKEENNQIKQMTLLIEQLQLQLKEARDTLNKAQTEIQNLNLAKIQLEKQKIENESKIKWFEAQTDRTYKEKMASEAKRRTEVEISQLYDGNPYNDKIRQL